MNGILSYFCLCMRHLNQCNNVVGIYIKIYIYKQKRQYTLQRNKFPSNRDSLGFSDNFSRESAYESNEHNNGTIER